MRARLTPHELVGVGKVHAADYIIVGGGRSGCVLANRLSLDPNVTVALLEAGRTDHQNPFAHFPYGRHRVNQDPRITRVISSHASSHVRPLSISQPQILGGHSNASGTSFLLGAAQDYERWKSPHWTVEELAPAVSNAFGPEGAVPRTRKTWRSDFCDDILQALHDGGFNRVEDIHSDPTHGTRCSFTEQCIEDGLRSSTPFCYLRGVNEERKNLKVIVDSLVNKVEVHERRATGITYLHCGEKHRITAKKEIIVCAGALATPFLLQHSGIGNPQDYEPFGVSFAAEVPGVGRNLLDQPSVRVTYPVDKRTLNHVLHGVFSCLRCFAELFLNIGGSRTGPLTTDDATITGLFKSSSWLEEADLGFQIQPYRTEGREIVSEGGITVSVFPLRPRSRGETYLASSDPRAAPHVYLNHFEEEIDRQAVLSGLDLLDEALSNIPFLGKRDQFSIERNTWSRQQIRGTCKMGKMDDIMTVVDDLGRVKGVDRLRIGGSSIVPENGSYDQGVLSIIIGERLGEIMTTDVKLLAQEKQKLELEI